jgi:hypothetical protein
VPASLERLISRGLTKKPSDRYATAEEFLAEIEYALHTSDGGATDVMLERLGDTGSVPLVSADGEVRIADGAGFVQETDRGGAEAIADAISDALKAPLPIPPTPITPIPPMRALAAAREAEAADDPAGRANATPKGGVGIGLPFTGPHGQPVFGMAPGQRLASARGKDDGVASTLEPDPRPSTRVIRRRRRWLYTAIAAGAIAAGVVGAVLTSRSAEQPPDPETPAGAASAALEHGDPARALQILEANKTAIESDGAAQLVMGHVHAARNEAGPALDSYETALRLDPDLETDEKLRAGLYAMAGGTDYEVVARAFDLWVGHTSDPEARRLLLLGAVHDDMARRKALRPVIERRRLGDHVDWLKAYSLDLEQDTPCEARREAVSKLRALGDVRAVEALERAIVKVGKSGIYRGKRINGCLIEDAKAAIGYLRGLSQK